MQQCVEQDEQEPDEQRDEDDSRATGEQQQDKRDGGEDRDDHAVPDAAPADQERPVRVAVAEEVEHEPGGEACEEDEHGDRPPEQGDEDDEQDHERVVGGEVREVGARAAVGV